MLTVPLNGNDYNDEVNILKHIAVVNGFHSSLIDKLIAKHLRKTQVTVSKQKTYVSADYGTFLSHPFRNIMNKNNVIVSFRTTNKLGSLLNERPNTKAPTFDKCGVYKLNCRTVRATTLDKLHAHLRKDSENIYLKKPQPLKPQTLQNI